MDAKTPTPPLDPLEGLYSLDVEADGPAPGLFSMVSIGLVRVDRPDLTFYAEMAPLSDRFVPGALAKCGFTREQTLGFASAAEGMDQLRQWLAGQPTQGRRVVWSDNPAFDWQFLNYYCHAFWGENPFGHSARRIGDFAAGLEGNPRKTSHWKKLRTCKHTHNALDDAKGNAGALAKLLTRRR